MKLTVAGEGLVEKALIKTGGAPTPIFDTFVAMLMARIIMVAVKAGIFEAIGHEAVSAQVIATRAGVDIAAATKILNALVPLGYIKHSCGLYKATGKTKKWLLKDSETSLHDNILFKFYEWECIEKQLEAYLETGKSMLLPQQQDLPKENIEAYHRGMRAVNRLSIKEVLHHVPVPDGAERMLDIGGSHGLMSVELCRRYPGLQGEVLDILPAVLQETNRFLAGEGMQDRITTITADALAYGYDAQKYDVIIISQLIHHFTSAENQQLFKRISPALKPGGFAVVIDFLRPRAVNSTGQPEALLDVFFALTSSSGTWSMEEIHDWQEGAGLTVYKPAFLRSLPGAAVLVAQKPHV